MIKVTFSKQADGKLRGFQVSGHSGYAEAGEDIVCASVSSAAYMAANTISEVIKADMTAEVDDAFLKVVLNDADSKEAQAVLEGFKLHIEALSDDYSDYIEIKEV